MMNHIFAGLLIASLSSNVGAKDCAGMIKKLAPYKEVVVAIEGAVAEVQGNGTVRHTFWYTYPNGVMEWSWTELPPTFTVEKGDLFLWTKANRAVRDFLPQEDRQVSVVVTHDCTAIQTDWSLPSAEIPF